MRAKRLTLKSFYIFFMYVAPIAFGACLFPLWKDSAPKMVSGMGVVALIVTTMAFRNRIKQLLSSPAPYLFVVIVFAVLFCIRLIVDDILKLLAVCFFCFLIGDVFRLLADSVNDEETEDAKEGDEK